MQNSRFVPLCTSGELVQQVKDGNLRPSWLARCFVRADTERWVTQNVKWTECRAHPSVSTGPINFLSPFGSEVGQGAPVWKTNPISDLPLQNEHGY